MNDKTDELEQADEDIPTYDVSDEALEAAADTDGKARHLTRQSFPCAGYPC